MINRIPGQSSALQLMKATADTSRTEAKKPASTLLEMLEKEDPDKAGALRKQMEDADSLLQQLKASKVDVSEQRKAAAQQKIQRIKAQLESLRLLASVNPEAAARRAAQLSRELAAAVKEYAAAGGGAGASASMMGVGGAGAAAGAAPSADGAASGATTAGAAVVAGGGGAETVSATGTATSGADAVPVSASPDGSGTGTGTGTGTGSEGGDEAGVPTGTEQGEPTTTDEASATPVEGADDAEGTGAEAEDNDKTVQERVRDASASLSQRFADAKGDQEFKSLVRDIKNKLKAILETAKRQLEQEGNDSADKDIKNAEKALQEVDQTLSQMMPGVMVGMVGGVNILA